VQSLLALAALCFCGVAAAVQPGAWVLGGGISGGCTTGEQIGISAGTLFQDRDLPVLNEYRSLLGYVFTHLYALSASDLAFVFPGAAPGKYSFL
jgi:uncharacterized protein (DUF1501 family)